MAVIQRISVSGVSGVSYVQSIVGTRERQLSTKAGFEMRKSVLNMS